MANKGDCAEPVCKVNNGGKQYDQLFASTLPLDATKLSLSKFSSEQCQNGKPSRLSFVDITKA